jgi:hypothetical protein
MSNGSGWDWTRPGEVLPCVLRPATLFWKRPGTGPVEIDHIHERRTDRCPTTDSLQAG